VATNKAGTASNDNRFHINRVLYVSMFQSIKGQNVLV
jgi:hypothetical protein